MTSKLMRIELDDNVIIKPLHAAVLENLEKNGARLKPTYPTVAPLKKPTYPTVAPSSSNKFCLRTDHALAGITGMYKIVDDVLVYRNTIIATPNTYRRITDEQFVSHLARRGCEQTKIKKQDDKTKGELQQFNPNDQVWFKIQ